MNKIVIIFFKLYLISPFVFAQEDYLLNSVASHFNQLNKNFINKYIDQLIDSEIDGTRESFLDKDINSGRWVTYDDYKNLTPTKSSNNIKKMLKSLFKETNNISFSNLNTNCSMQNGFVFHEYCKLSFDQLKTNKQINNDINMQQALEQLVNTLSNNNQQSSNIKKFGTVSHDLQQYIKVFDIDNAIKRLMDSLVKLHNSILESRNTKNYNNNENNNPNNVRLLHNYNEINSCYLASLTQVMNATEGNFSNNNEDERDKTSQYLIDYIKECRSAEINKTEQGIHPLHKLGSITYPIHQEERATLFKQLKNSIKNIVNDADYKNIEQTLDNALNYQNINNFYRSKVTDDLIQKSQLIKYAYCLDKVKDISGACNSLICAKNRSENTNTFINTLKKRCYDLFSLNKGNVNNNTLQTCINTFIRNINEINAQELINNIYQFLQESSGIDISKIKKEDLSSLKDTIQKVDDLLNDQANFYTFFYTNAQQDIGEAFTCLDALFDIIHGNASNYVEHYLKKANTNWKKYNVTNKVSIDQDLRYYRYNDGNDDIKPNYNIFNRLQKALNDIMIRSHRNYYEKKNQKDIYEADFAKDCDNSKTVINYYPKVLYFSSPKTDKEALGLAKWTQQNEFVPFISKDKKLVIYQLKGIGIRSQGGIKQGPEKITGVINDGHYTSIVHVNGNWHAVDSYPIKISGPSKTLTSIYSAKLNCKNNTYINAANFTGYRRIYYENL